MIKAEHFETSQHVDPSRVFASTIEHYGLSKPVHIPQSFVLFNSSLWNMSIIVDEDGIGLTDYEEASKNQDQISPNKDTWSSRCRCALLCLLI